MACVDHCYVLPPRRGHAPPWPCARCNPTCATGSPAPSLRRGKHNDLVAMACVGHCTCALLVHRELTTYCSFAVVVCFSANKLNFTANARHRCVLCRSFVWSVRTCTCRIKSGHSRLSARCARSPWVSTWPQTHVLTTVGPSVQQQPLWSAHALFKAM